jgi:hypothetical protein
MPRKAIKNLVFSTALMCIMGVVFSFFTTFAAPDAELTYHGKLTDTLGVSVSNGSYNFTIRIFDQETGGTCLWSARGTCGSPSPKTLTITNGIFSTILGGSGDNPISLVFDDNYYLEIQIDANPAMTPRRKITPTGFALNSHRLNGLAADNYINTSTTAQTKQGSLTINDDFTVNANDFFVDTSTGNVGIGTASPIAALHTISTTEQFRLGYNSSNYLSTTVGSTGTVTFDSIGAVPRFAFQDELSINGNFSNFTVNTDALFVNAFTKRVGIGTSTPNHRLHLYGTSSGGADIYSQTTSAFPIKHWFANAVYNWSIGQIGTSQAPNYQFRITDETAGLTRLGIDTLGRVGIGTTLADAQLHTVATTEQMRLGYNATNYLSTTVNATGTVTFNAVGTGQGFTFNDPMLISGNLTTAGHILPNTDNAYDLGSNTNRFRDLYLGPSSLHIGTNGNEGIISYDTTNNVFNFDKVVSLGDTIFLNEGFGNVANGPDIQFDLQGLLASHSNMFFNIDSDNNDTDSSFVFSKDSNTSFATRLMSIQENGYMGIGSTPPNEKLEVTGNILLNNPSNNAAVIINSSTDGYGIHSMFRMQSTETGSGENMAGAEISRNAYFQTSDDNHYRDDNTASSARLRFDANGAIYLSNAVAGTGAITWDDQFIAYNNGTIDIPGVYSTTTAAAANVYIASNGRLYRSTSSSRYKDDISYDLNGDLIYDLKPASYRDKNNGKKYIGFVAEDVAKVESLLVDFDEHGRPDALHYGNFSALITQAVQDQKKLISKNENNIALKASGDILLEIQDDVVSLREDANAQAKVARDIAQRIELAESGIDVLVALSESDLTKISDLLAINAEDLVFLNEDEGLTINGITTMKEISAEKLIITGEEDDAIIGVAAIAKDTYDVFVETKAVRKESRIFVTARGNVITQPLSVTSIDEKNGFHVTVAAPVDESLEFDWMIVQDQIKRDETEEEAVSKEGDNEIENAEGDSVELREEEIELF